MSKSFILKKMRKLFGEIGGVSDLVELKGKFKGMAQGDFFIEKSHDQIVASSQTDPADEARDALIALGYKPADAEKMIKKVNKAGATSEQLIREALKNSL